MQQWELFPCYVEAKCWDRFRSPELNNLAALDVLLEFLHGMGLRHPSEPTQALLVSLLVLREQDPAKRSKMKELPSLRTLFMAVKSRLKSRFSALLSKPVPGGTYLVSLPADPAQASEELKAYCFVDGQPASLPWTMEEIVAIAKDVRLRGPHKATPELGFGGPEFSQQMQMMQSMCLAMAMAQRAMAPPTASGDDGLNLTFNTNAKKNKLESLLDRATSAESLPSSSSKACPPQPAPLALEDQALPAATGAVAPSVVVGPFQTAKQVDSNEKSQEAVPCESQQRVNLEPAEAKLRDLQMPKACVAQEPEQEVDKMSLPNDQVRKVSLSESLKLLSEARAQPKLPVSKAGAKKRPASALTEQKSKVLKRPASKLSPKPKSSAKTANKKKSSKMPAGLTREERKKQILSVIPPRAKFEFRQGCKKCRFVAGCTVSCWRYRGWQV